MAIPKIHLIEGPVGAGKSTYARELSQRLGAPWLCLDEWIARLFLPDRPPGADVGWYLDRKARCEGLIWRVATEILTSGNDVVLELGLVQRADRHAFYDRADEAGFGVCVYVVDAPVAVRRERVQRRNLERGDTFSVEITDEMFERASRWWEPLDDKEYTARIVVDINTQH